MSDADLPFVADLYASTRMEELSITGWSAAQKQAFLLQQHGAQHRHYTEHYPGAEWHIIERGGVPIGRLYRVTWSREIRIMDIALAPEARGGGIGTAIVSAIQAEAASAEKAVSIHVEKNNPAHTLYERLGFTVAADKGVYDLMEWTPAGAGQVQKNTAS